MRQVTTLDFTGHRIYCGIDVHKKSWSVCLRKEDRELKVFSQDSDPHLLSRYLKSHYPNASFEIVYEAGFCGFWPQQDFVKEGLDCRVVHPADIPQPDKNRRYKTDPVDCRKLALELQKGSLNFIHIPQQSTIESRALVRTRQQLVHDQTRYKNRILSMLNFFGVKIPAGFKEGTYFSKRFLDWLLQLPLNPEPKISLNIKINMLLSVREQLLAINKELRKIAFSELYRRRVELLLTIPSIGITSALIIVTEIEDIKRFRSFDHLASFAGFAPDVYSSGEKSVVKGITHHCDHLLRETLVECAWMAISKDPALMHAYYEYKKRMHYNKAIIRVAKKLLNRIRYVLVNDKPYVCSFKEEK